MQKYLLVMPLIILFFLVAVTNSQNSQINISNDLEIRQLSENAYVHISYYDYPNYPHCPANGLVYINRGKAFIIDTPWTDQETHLLIGWLRDSLKVSIEGVVVTHWHIDCMGGLNEIHTAGIRSYSNYMTAEIAKVKRLPVPQITFRDSLTLKLEGKSVVCRYLGAGHTRDNIIVWLPAEKILFAGCMVKALDWKSLGFIGDADLTEWPHTLQKVQDNFSAGKIVIPGHGDYGDLNLIRHTMDLLKEK